MQYRAVVLSLSCFLFAACSETTRAELVTTRAQRIVGGTREPQSTFLTAGQQKAVIFLTDGVQEFCSGTLVAPRLVVTAQHCVARESAGSFFIGLGTLPSAPDALLPVGAVHEHPSLDFALVVLGADATVAVPEAVPIAMNRAALDATWNGRLVDAAGYGDTRTTARGRFFAAVTIIGSDSEFVTVDGEGVQGICYGDSGGPVLWQQDALTPPVVLGAESYGDPTCVDVDHLTRVDLAAPWVDGIVAAGLPPEVTPCAIPNDPGHCDGGVAAQCIAGYLYSEDCASFGESCGYLGPGNGYGCLPASCGTLDARGRCDGNTLSWCGSTGLRTRDCDVVHRACVWVDDAIGHDCAGCYTCGGVCAELTTSLEHCGACDKPCAPEHATGRCVNGSCYIARCTKGWLDDNDDPRDGCELEDPGGCAATRAGRLVALTALVLLGRRRRARAPAAP